MANEKDAQNAREKDACDDSIGGPDFLLNQVLSDQDWIKLLKDLLDYTVKI